MFSAVPDWYVQCPKITILLQCLGGKFNPKEDSKIGNFGTMKICPMNPIDKPNEVILVLLRWRRYYGCR